MSLRFALRPRIRLHESEARPRRERKRLPPVVFPIAAYWLGMAALTHVVILVGKGEAAEREASEREDVEAAAPETNVAETSPLRVTSELPPEPRTVAPLQPAAELSETTDSIEPEPPQAPRSAQPEPRDAPRLAEPPRPARTTESESRRAALAVESDERVEEREEPVPSVALAEAPPPPKRESVPVSSGLPSCESVLDSASQSVDFDDSRSRTPDLPEEAFSRVLNHGGYLSGCSIPDGTALDICVAVQEGRVRGVSVQASPSNARVSACVAAAAARLRFPYSPRVDVARTHFDALR